MHFFSMAVTMHNGDQSLKTITNISISVSISTHTENTKQNTHIMQMSFIRSITTLDVSCGMLQIGS